MYSKTITLFFFLYQYGTSNAQNFCDQGPVTFVAGVSADSAGLAGSFEAFRTLLGGENNGNNVQAGGFTEGHRQVNWDAAVVPFDMPGNFFAEVVTRGMTVTSDQNEFRVSNPTEGGDNRFDSINSSASSKFQTFSPERLFTPVETNEFNVIFTVPGAPTAATVDGFGGVFADVDEGTTTMTWYAQSGCVIATQEVPRSPSGGLSFLGAISTTPPIFRVEIELGTDAIDEDDAGRSCSGFLSFLCNIGLDAFAKETDVDLVVMDDFLYSEPQAV